MLAQFNEFAYDVNCFSIKETQKGLCLK